MAKQVIPIEHLNLGQKKNLLPFSKIILENEIEGIKIEHTAVSFKTPLTDTFTDDYKTIYLFIKGRGKVVASSIDYEIQPETILLPNMVKSMTIEAAPDEVLHYLKISCLLSIQDQMDLEEFPAENTQQVYYAKFSECQSYSEPIKSPNTVSRTILPNKIIPRIAMGTVKTKGPDQVGAHEHPMLEQLFLGLSTNNCIVYADEAKVAFPEYALLHIPLGSRHSVSVEEEETLYYVWMDFFLDKAGEAWLETHIVNEVD